ncbi:YhgE/Pip domain-containing protein [Fictibacillus phosphorivorans]|uniref:YhgE/Pip domain-containing protein n=1 Tax=Fictibacillus phosphorivorans TaxID=1221500 RepID=UPI00203FB131|nr:YhgE/Pip domain-containing protein [Fictibacillus phosphorivorans]MCM3717475.1 YhgE/Pip domain-containing protein [Fictibacillus phosphorivorans]MCM3775170.1 YhgE/Pip domain-containing protein [Fictibacillus phosphorivorans]
MFTSIRAQFKAVFSNKKIAIPIFAVLFIPVLYTGMFLWAFWDPYDKMEELPVAVVNLDEGYSYNGDTLDVGDEFVKKLKENPQFKWDFVNAKEAQQGLEDNRYYMMIEIPENFSEKATSLSGKNNQKPELIYTPNAGFNFLAAQIGGTAVDKMKESVSNELTKTYAEVMFDQVEQLAGGLDQAADGSRKITDGLEKASSGSGELAKGMTEKTPQIKELESGAALFHSKMNEFDSGMDQLLTAHKKLATGTEALNIGAQSLKSGLSQATTGSKKIKDGSLALKDGAEKLSAGAGTLAKSANEWNSGAQKAAAGSKQVEQEINQLIQNQQNMSDEEIAVALKQIAAISGGVNKGMDGLTAASRKIAGGANEISAGAKKLSDSQTAVAQGAEQLHSGQLKLVDGVDQLASGQEKVNTGTQTFQAKLGEAASGSQQLLAASGKIADGTATVSSGWQEVTGHVNEIHNGEQKLLEGSGELSFKLREAADKTGELDPNSEMFERIANPVSVKTKSFSDVPNYGTGFAPYFLSLGLFVGALLMSIVFPLRDQAGNPRSGFGWFASKFSFLAAVGVVQALIADAVLLFGLNIEVSNLPAFIGLSIITSLTFLAVVQLLVTVLGDPGRFVAIIILILQLTTSAGTFPLELIPDGLQIFNTWLPMTYSVSGFKAVISSGDMNSYLSNLWVLIGFMVLCMIGTWSYFATHFRKSNKQKDEVTA